jgi:hypothetical protein
MQPFNEAIDFSTTFAMGWQIGVKSPSVVSEPCMIETHSLQGASGARSLPDYP